MGSGAWSSRDFEASVRTRGFSTVDAFRNSTVRQMYTQKTIDPDLDPRNTMRECCDTKEHPNTVPVILALDVTGSMGSAAQAVAGQLDDIMAQLYKRIRDIEFMTMAIGDVEYDKAPLQVSQFESDIRISEQLAKIWFEGGGGGNSFESYTAAWYYGLYHTKLDCWKRGRKGIIITMGDEPLNPHLRGSRLANVTGDPVNQDCDTEPLYEDTLRKFDIYHIAVNDPHTSYTRYASRINDSWGQLLGDHLVVSTCEKLFYTISDIVISCAEKENQSLNGGTTSWNI